MKSLFPTSVLSFLFLGAPAFAAPFNPNGGQKNEPVTVISAVEPLPAASEPPKTASPKTMAVAPETPQNIAPRPVTINATTRNETNALNPCVLAEKGEAQVKIVIAAEAGVGVKKAADDLKFVLGKMTGAEWEIQTGGDGKSGLVIGTQQQFPHPELEAALKIYSGSAENVEAYAIRTNAVRVLLLGNTDLGAADAAYRFLDELGYRQLGPGPNWEVIPGYEKPVNRDPKAPAEAIKPRSLSWTKDITDRPEVIARNVWAALPAYGGGDWAWRNNHHQGIGINAGHNYRIAPWNPQRWKDEWWSLIGDKRTPGTQIDYGNPEARQYVIDYALDFFQKNPGADMVSLGPSDNGSWSQSPEFQQLGSISDAVFGMVNDAAKAVEREFPGKMVGVYAYREYGNPPSFRLEPNVYVQITPALFNAIPNLIEEWQKKCSNLGRYDYYSVFQWGQDGLPGSNVAAKSYLVPRIANYVAQNATSIDGESSGGWFAQGHGYWIAAKLMWNTSLDYDELKTDYLKSAFGPAYEPMHDFYELRNWENHFIISTNLLSDMRRDLDKASALAKNRPDVLARLDDFKLYFRYLELGAKAAAIPAKGDTADAHAEAKGQMFNLVARSGQTKMFDTFQGNPALNGNFAGEDFAKHPELKPGAPNSVWNGEPITKADIDVFWPQTQEFFNLPHIEQKNFDQSDLVPINWQNITNTGLPDDKGVYIQFQSGVIGYEIYSLHGEPLKVSANYNYPGPQKWTLKDKTGEIVAQGAAFEGGVNNQTWEMPVPGPGNYHFEIGSQGGWINVVVLGGQLVSSDFTRNGYTKNFGQVIMPTYFYVPKGTKSVDIYAPADLKILGPDGKVVFEQTGVAGQWVSVPVPAGLDSTVWQFAAGFNLYSAPTLGNIPKIGAVSPSRLLVPRDIALKDGLSIRQ